LLEMVAALRPIGGPPGSWAAVIRHQQGSKKYKNTEADEKMPKNLLPFCGQLREITRIFWSLVRVCGHGANAESSDGHGTYCIISYRLLRAAIVELKVQHEDV